MKIEEVMVQRRIQRSLDDPQYILLNLLYALRNDWKH
jgi:hypothetical protein